MDDIKLLELDIMYAIDYKVHAPTVLDFLKVYLQDLLGIHVHSKSDTEVKE